MTMWTGPTFQAYSQQIDRITRERLNKESKKELRRFVPGSEIETKKSRLVIRNYETEFDQSGKRNESDWKRSKAPLRRYCRS
jgi:hypothetical protein